MTDYEDCPVGMTMADLWRRDQIAQLAEEYEREGYDPDTAMEMACEAWDYERRRPEAVYL